MRAPRTETGPSRKTFLTPADINARGLEFRETPLAAAVRCEQVWCKEEDRPTLAWRRRQMFEFLLKSGAGLARKGELSASVPRA
jgi:hypothetical protein